MEGISNDLIDPAEMMLRGAYCWQQTHWPGRGWRVHYAHTLFNLYVLRCLQFLSLQVRGLSEVQALLDELWRSSPANQPAFVRDARWLVPLAQSLITDALEPYFDVAQLVEDTLTDADVLEIQKAHVRMLGGHLTSQIRHYSTKDGVPFDHHSVVLGGRGTPMRSTSRCWCRGWWCCFGPMGTRWNGPMRGCGSTWRERFAKGSHPIRNCFCIGTICWGRTR